MSNIVHLDQTQIEEILKIVPDEIKENILRIITPSIDTGIDVLRTFVKEFENDCIMDGTIAYTCACIITEIANGYTNLGPVTKDNKVRGTDLAKVVINSLRSEACKIEEVINKNSVNHKKH